MATEWAMNTAKERFLKEGITLDEACAAGSFQRKCLENHIALYQKETGADERISADFVKWAVEKEQVPMELPPVLDKYGLIDLLPPVYKMLRGLWNKKT